jgi:hypothetical protein
VWDLIPGRSSGQSVNVSTVFREITHKNALRIGVVLVVRLHRKIAPSGYACLFKDCVQMVFDCLLGYAQALSDLSVIVPKGNKLNNLTLAFRE